MDDATKQLKRKILSEVRTELSDLFDQNFDRQAYFDSTGGFLAVDLRRIARGVNKNEKAKLEKELHMAETYARAGAQVVMLGETPGVPSPDVTYNGTYAELKRVRGSNNIASRARKAVQRQGAELVLFQVDEMTNEALHEIRKLAEKGVHGKYFVTGEEGVVYSF